MDSLSKDAQRLLRAAGDLHAEREEGRPLLVGDILPLEKAATRANLDVERQPYHDAIAELEYEGAIEWDENARFARGAKHYLITRQGLLFLAQVQE